MWHAALIGAGYELGARWCVVERRIGEASNAIHVVLGVVLAVVVFPRARRRPARRRAHGAR